MARVQTDAACAGMSYKPLKAVGEKIDLVNLMSYDADNQYSPVLATQVGHAEVTSLPVAFCFSRQRPAGRSGTHRTGSPHNDL